MPATRMVAVLCAVIAIGCGRPAVPGSPSPAQPGSPGAPIVLAIARVMPNAGLTGNTIPVIVEGSGFAPGTTVTFGTVSVAVVRVSSTQITGTVSSAGSGLVDVVVTNPDGTTARLPSAFTFEPARPLAVTRLSLTSGITAGSDWLDLHGAFQGLVRVTMGGQPAILVSASATTVFVLTPPNPVGAVDVVVTSPDGQSVTLRGAFTYLPNYAGDFNGSWEGCVSVDCGPLIQFTIERDKLIGVKCGSSPLRTLTVPAPVVAGGFSVLEPDGFEITGSLISSTEAGGLVKGDCDGAAIGWRAWR